MWFADCWAIKVLAFDGRLVLVSCLRDDCYDSCLNCSLAQKYRSGQRRPVFGQCINQDNDSALDQTDNTSSTTDLSPVFLPMAHPGAAETALPVWRFSSSPTTSGDASNSSQPDEGSLPQADASISANATAANPLPRQPDLRHLVLWRVSGQSDHVRQRACLRKHLRCELHRNFRGVHRRRRGADRKPVHQRGHSQFYLQNKAVKEITKALQTIAGCTTVSYATLKAGFLAAD